MAGTKCKEENDAKSPSIVSEWKQLTTPSRSRCPKLFYKFRGHEDGYFLDLTDLVGLWTATASRSDIYTHAKETRASIDPTAESQGQYNVLLKKLDESLAGGDNTIYQDEISQDEAILLRTVLPLSKPLLPLKWEFQLAGQGASEMAEHILRPCLHQASQAKEQIDSLMGVMKHKDLVIEKLFDRLIATGQDPSVIWPNLGNVRMKKGQKMKRSDAAHVVLGLDEFDKNKWRNARKFEGPYGGFEAEGLGNLIAGCEKCPKHSTKDHEKWLSRLPKSTATKSQIANIVRSSSPVRNDTDSENEFESIRPRKPLPESMNGREPPALTTAESSALPSSPPLPPIQESDIEDSEGSLTASESEDEQPIPAPKPFGRIGGIGGLKKMPSRFENSSPASSPPLRPIDARSDTLSPEPVPKSPAKPKKEPPINSTPKRSATPKKMGRIGGTRQLTPTRELPMSPQKQKQQSSMQPPRPRLGQIGSSHAAQSQSQTIRGLRSNDTMSAKRNDVSNLSDNEANVQKADLYDSGSSTKSEPASPSPKAKQTPATLGAIKQSTSPSKSRTMSSPVRDPTSEPKKVLSKEEQVAQKRDELKRKMDASNAVGTVRKKRKF